MTRRKKIALMKKGVKLMEPVLREEAALVPAARLALGRRAAEGVVQALPLKNIKKLGLLAGGALLGLTAVNSALRTQSMRLAVSRELKKQLKPIHEKLDRLEKENEELRKKQQN
ncbi:MAG: hypothetical protein IJK35_00020 [Oscillospiraceae bacterium]|nr:hypothetical protein [Oscillospiraceae bacterium]